MNVRSLKAACKYLPGVVLMVFCAPCRATTDAETLETVVVTAQKYSESSLDVPMGLTALSGEQLERSQSFRMEDFVGNIPGLTFISGGGGGGELVIRGLTLGGADVSSGVAIYIDETPFLASNPFTGNGAAAPDLDTYDMQRIEVLKGPQGTLYGSNALGGLFKYVTNAPDPSGLAASAQAGFTSVHDGAVGYDTHGMLNVPLASDLALRVSAYDTRYGGYIDDPGRNLKDINGDRFAGGRASLLYQPNDALSIRLMALYQNRRANDIGDGAEDVNPVTLTPINGNLTQERLIGQPETEDAAIYNLTVKWDAGFASLMSTSSYLRSNTHVLADYTQLYGPYTPVLLGANYGVAYSYLNAFSTLTEEVRLASQGQHALDWQVGGYFTNQDGTFNGSLPPFTLPNGPVLYNSPPSLIYFDEPTYYREYAGFVNLDYHLTSALDVALGGRYSSNDQHYQEMLTGILGGGVSNVKTSMQDVFTYSGDVRWHFVPDSMLYTRIAKGYVPGGPNDTFPGNPLPAAYRASTTINYEAGIKSSLMQKRLTAELSVFDVEWRDIQLGVTINGFGGYDNAGSARSRGAEWNFAYVPVSGLTLRFNGAYTQANLGDVPSYVTSSLGANSHDFLPFVPKWQASTSIDYERPLFGDWSGLAGLNARFTGMRQTNFEVAGPRETLPEFTIVDLRTGLENRTWTFSLYVKNVANKLAFNSVVDATGAGTLGPQTAYVYRPRTFGFTVAAHF